MVKDQILKEVQIAKMIETVSHVSKSGKTLQKPWLRGWLSWHKPCHTGSFRKIFKQKENP